jgi:hypothetical protein
MSLPSPPNPASLWHHLPPLLKHPQCQQGHQQPRGLGAAGVWMPPCWLLCWETSWAAWGEGPSSSGRQRIRGQGWQRCSNRRGECT